MTRFLQRAAEVKVIWLAMVLGTLLAGWLFEKIVRAVSPKETHEQ